MNPALRSFRVRNSSMKDVSVLTVQSWLVSDKVDLPLLLRNVNFILLVIKNFHHRFFRLCFLLGTAVEYAHHLARLRQRPDMLISQALPDRIPINELHEKHFRFVFFRRANFDWRKFQLEPVARILLCNIDSNFLMNYDLRARISSKNNLSCRAHFERNWKSKLPIIVQISLADFKLQLSCVI